MEERRRAFVKAFPIPHLENNAFLYADLPASFQLPGTQAPKSEYTLKIQEKPQDNKSKEAQEAIKPEIVLEDRVETAEIQSTRCSSQSAEEPKSTPLPYERNLLAECKKLMANVNAMKQRHSLEDCKSRSSSPIPAASKPVSTPGQGKGHGGMTRFSLEDGFKSGKRTNSRRKDTDEQETTPNASIASIPPLASQSKSNKENSEAKKAVRRSLSRGEKATFSGAKPNVGYLKDVYTVIEQHARHCQDLKKDLRRLKSEFEENLSRIRHFESPVLLIPGKPQIAHIPTASPHISSPSLPNRCERAIVSRRDILYAVLTLWTKVYNMGFCISKEPRALPLYSKSISPSEATTPSVRLRSTYYTDIQQTYVFKKVLGHGQFGTVREATSLISQQQVAVKSISKEKTGTNLHLLRRELEIMRLLDHPNVIKYLETCEDEKYIHIVMELCTGGDLFDKLIAMGSLSESYAAEILTSLLLAVSHLHSLGICHRDLKPENFLFETSQPGALIKIIDFGLSIKQTDTGEMNSLVGTPYFLAPEVLQGKYGPKCDVWSLGVVLYFLLSGKPPFEGSTRKDLYTAISRTKLDFSDPIWDGISHLAQNLLQQMLTKRPSDRISISEAINHPWFQSLKEENVHTVPPTVLQLLKNHKSPKKLQREVMKIMLKFLSTAEIEELRQAFLDLDQTKSGFLTAVDIEKAIEKAGFPLQVEEIRSKCHLEIATSFETATIGQIHYSDFLLATLDKKKLLDDELLYLTFQHFDSDFDGFVDIKDLKQAFESLGDSGSLQEIEEMVADWDLDHNHLIDFEEFRKMMAEGKELYSESRSFQAQNSQKRGKSLHKTLRRLTTLCD